MTADGTQTRERLLREARDLYLIGGVANVSVREVARRAGVSAAAVYRHYDGRVALLRAVCETGFGVFSTYLLRALAASTPRERLVECARQYLRFGMERSQDYRVMFMGAADDVASFLPEGGPAQSPTFQFLVDRVRECGGHPAESLALSIWAHVHGLVSLRLSGQLCHGESDAVFGALYEASTVRVLSGLGL